MTEIGMKEYKPNEDNNNPEMNRHLTDNASTQVIEGNTVLGGTALPIVAIVSKEIVIADQAANIDLGYTFKIYHDLGTANQVFGRYRGKGEEYWHGFPTNLENDGTIGGTRFIEINEITAQYVEIDFHDFDIYEKYEFQLFFTSLHF